MLGKDNYSSANLFLSFNDLFHRMTGAEYWLHVQIWKFLRDDLTEALDRLSNLTLFDGWGADLQGVHFAHYVK
jgi:hypothetical protein